jgi:hypothetical protein
LQATNANANAAGQSFLFMINKVLKNGTAAAFWEVSAQSPYVKSGTM